MVSRVIKQEEPMKTLFLAMIVAFGTTSALAVENNMGTFSQREMRLPSEMGGSQIDPKGPYGGFFSGAYGATLPDRLQQEEIAANKQ